MREFLGKFFSPKPPHDDFDPADFAGQILSKEPESYSEYGELTPEEYLHKKGFKIGDQFEYTSSTGKVIPFEIQMVKDSFSEDGVRRIEILVKNIENGKTDFFIADGLNEGDRVKKISH